MGLLHRWWSSPLDPMKYPRDSRRFNSNVIIDACRPFGWADLPAAAEATPEDKARVLGIASLLCYIPCIMEHETDGPKVQVNMRVREETRRLLDLAAACESRALGEIVDDAVRLYVRSRSAEYRAYFGLAQRFLEAAEGSEEEALARADLAAGIGRDIGLEVQRRGGDALAVRARLRQRRTVAAPAD